MLKNLSISIAGAALFTSGNLAQASTITLESVPFNSVDVRTEGGFDVNDQQFLGWRFELDSTFQITDIGGSFFGTSFIPNREIFGAIISLSEPDALPLGSPFLPEEVLAATTFTTPVGHNDLLIPLEVRLDSGNYGLVFGSGLFDATGGSIMSFLDGMPFNEPEFFRWDVNVFPMGSIETRWVGGSSPTRFVVVGSTPVPETSSVLSLLALGTIGLGSALLRRKTK